MTLGGVFFHFQTGDVRHFCSCANKWYMSYMSLIINIIFIFPLINDLAELSQVQYVPPAHALSSASGKRDSSWFAATVELTWLVQLAEMSGTSNSAYFVCLLWKGCLNGSLVTNSTWKLTTIYSHLLSRVRLSRPCSCVHCRRLSLKGLSMLLCVFAWCFALACLCEWNVSVL